MNREGQSQRKRTKGKTVLLLAGLAVLLVLIPALLFLDHSGARAYRATVQKATADYQAGDYDSALSGLRKAESMRHNDETLMLMADCYEAQDNLDMALQILRQMDTGDNAVADRIASLEQRRLQRQAPQTIWVADRELGLDLEELYLDERGLTAEDLTDLKQLHQLSSLSLRGNQIEDLSILSSLGGLSRLDLSGNPIRSLAPLADLAGLRFLILDGTQVEDLSPLGRMSNLSLLSLLGTGVSGEQVDELSMALPDCAIHTDTEDPGVMRITLGGVSFRSDADRLDLSDMGLHDLSALEPCTGLRSLRLNGNEISDLQPLMNLSSLQELELAENRLQDLRPLMGMSSLKKLNVSRNLITDTQAAGAIRSLETLDLSGNPIRDYSGLSGLKNLDTLHLEETGIQSEQLQELAGLSSLRLLYLDGNQGLSDDAVSRLRSSLPSCAINHSDLVYTIELAGGIYFSDLTELDLSGKGIDDLSGIERFHHLEKLNLGHNSIQNLLNLQLGGSRDRLLWLDLSYNQINDLGPLGDLSNLETLDLSGNQIENLQPLTRLKALRRLSLTGNPLNEKELEKLRDALPDCEIIF